MCEGGVGKGLTPKPRWANSACSGPDVMVELDGGCEVSPQRALVRQGGGTVRCHCLLGDSLRRSKWLDSINPHGVRWFARNMAP